MIQLPDLRKSIVKQAQLVDQDLENNYFNGMKYCTTDYVLGSLNQA